MTMKIAVVLLFAFLTQILFVRTNVLHNPEFLEYDDKLGIYDDTSISTTNQGKCGGFINATGVIYINYKPFEEILPNERCVWIIMSAHNTNVSLSYSVTANSLGFPTTERLLSFASLQKRTETIATSYPSGIGSTVTMTGRVLLVTFSSKANTSGLNGFTLTVIPGARGNGVNADSRYEILKMEDFYHRHPKSPGNYLASELSAFVIPPVGFNGRGFQKQIVRCKEIQLEGSSMADWIGVHFFDATTNSWNYKGRLGGQFALEKITHEDIILIVFDSDAVRQFEGFELHTLSA